MGIQVHDTDDIANGCRFCDTSTLEAACDTVGVTGCYSGTATKSGGIRPPELRLE